MNTGRTGIDVTRRPGTGAGASGGLSTPSAEPHQGGARAPLAGSSIRETAFRPEETDPKLGQYQQTRQGQRELPNLGNNTPTGPLQNVRKTNVEIPVGTDTGVVADILARQNNPAANQFRQIVPDFRASLQNVHDALSEFYTKNRGTIPPKEIRDFIIAFRAMESAGVKSSPVFDQKTADVLDKLWGVFGQKAPRNGEGKIFIDRSSLALMDFLQGNIDGAITSINSITADSKRNRTHDHNLAQIKALASIVLPYQSKERPPTAQTGMMRRFIESIRYTPTNLNEGRIYITTLDKSLLAVTGVSKNPLADSVIKLETANFKASTEAYQSRFEEISNAEEDYGEEIPESSDSPWARLSVSGGGGGGAGGGGNIYGAYKYDPNTGSPQPLKGYDGSLPTKPADFPAIPPYINEVLTSPSRHATCLWFSLRNTFYTYTWRGPNDDFPKENIYERYKKWGLEESPYGSKKLQYVAKFDRTPPWDNGHDVAVEKGTEILAQADGYVLDAREHIPRSRDKKGRPSNKGYGITLVMYYPHQGVIITHNHLKGINPAIIDALKNGNGEPVYVNKGFVVAQTGNSGNVKSSKGGDGSHDHSAAIKFDNNGFPVQYIQD